jgi:hypothetical protein
MLYYIEIAPFQKEDYKVLSKAVSSFSSAINNGFQAEPIELPEYKTIENYAEIMQEKLSVLNENDIVIYQHQYYDGFEYIEKILDEIHSKKAKSIFYIHDTFALRAEQVPNGNFEIRLMNKADVVITHSLIMSNLLTAFGVESKKIIQGPFTYTSELPQTIPESNDYKKVLYAGFLPKALWLLTYNQETPISIYGEWFEDALGEAKNISSKIQLMGAVASDELPVNSFNGFGLVWDGWNAPMISANGRYGAVNMPFKFSMYVANGLPVIVPKDSALAPYVIEHGIGIVLENLENLDSEISKIFPDEYIKMRKSTQAFGEKIRSGRFTIDAIKEAVEYLK